MDKASKAKTLATASTLQKVVCPAPERDPQEILSNGWRKVGEQKRYTNRLANGHPDHGIPIPSRESSFSDSANQTNRQNGRQVLDKMFGHLRPHHNIVPTAVLRPEDAELENGLGTQAARVAFYRPAIAPALAALPTDAQIAEGGPALATRHHPPSQTQPQAQWQIPAAQRASGVVSGSDWSDAEGATHGAEDERPSPSPGSPRNARYRKQATAGAGAGANGSLVVPTPPQQPPPPVRMSSLSRVLSLTRAASLNAMSGSGGGGSSGGGARTGGSGGGASPTRPSDRRATLPSVARSYPTDQSWGGASSGPAQHGHPGSGHGSPGADAPRPPPATASTAPSHGHRRASISGDSGLPLIAIAMLSNGGSTGTAVMPAARAPGSGAGRTRRASHGPGLGVSGGGGVASGAAGPQTHRTAASGSGGGSATAMPQIVVRRSSSFRGPTEQSLSADAAAARAGGGGGGVGSPAVTSPTWGPVHSLPIVTGASGGPLLRWSNNGAPNPAALGAEAAAVPTALAHVGLLAQIGEVHGGGGGGGGGPGTAHPAGPLSGLDNLAATGLADAISQLRNIRMAGGSTGGAGPGSGAAKERKVEPGLAGVMPLQLLPVSLPPVDSWQVGGRQPVELDPCRGIRLVDTANYVLPRATAEVCLQAKMAHHQAAMRDLVKAEGAPMSEMEMEAVRLLGRLERSGARHRNFDNVGEDGGGGAAAAATAPEDGARPG